MDAAQALADLTEVSSQTESAVLADADGRVLAASGAGSKVERVAEGALTLLRASESAAGDRAQLTQLVAETRQGAVFVVRERDWIIVAVTTSHPTIGLIFYDLRTCLRLAAEPAPGDETRGDAAAPPAEVASERPS
ncbi:MAG: roadblock/LC7 domain-containing protein, partial [Actinomycetota bacterium]|nr:roadblock/LC7 domain-containing protein [Actinomycetota bacterium]